MTIRTFTEQDTPEVIALWTQVFNYDTPRNDPAVAIRKKLAVQGELLFVADEDGQVAGTIMGGYDGHRGWMYSLAVAAQFRRRGLGRQLVSYLEQRLAEMGCLKINLQVVATNAAVVGFYEKLGYTVEPRISMGKVL